jgi:RNA polymerase sigma-70 factor (ECF subfamily)
MFLWCYVYVMSRVESLPEHNDEWRELGKCALPPIEILPEGYREALLLSEIDGPSLKEVAERLNLSLSCVKSRVRRGMERLKRAFLGCCHFKFDFRGKPIDWWPKEGCARIYCCFFSTAVKVTQSLE